jgi:hypothetical protein
MHADKVMQALAECIKAIQGMTGKARKTQAAQDLQCIIDATQARIQTFHTNLKKPLPQTIFAHAMSSEGACTSKHSPTTNQGQQMNHLLHATAGTNSEDTHRYS